MRISDWSSDVCSSDLLEETYAESRLRLPSMRRAPKKLNGFTVQRGRLGVPTDDFFAKDPVRLVEMFALAEKHELEVHPQAMRQEIGRASCRERVWQSV